MLSYIYIRVPKLYVSILNCLVKGYRNGHRFNTASAATTKETYKNKEKESLRGYVS